MCLVLRVRRKREDSLADLGSRTCFSLCVHVHSIKNSQKIKIAVYKKKEVKEREKGNQGRTGSEASGARDPCPNTDYRLSVTLEGRRQC